jgi:hypothetical protein
MKEVLVRRGEVRVPLPVREADRLQHNGTAPVKREAARFISPLVRSS